MALIPSCETCSNEIERKLNQRQSLILGCEPFTLDTVS